MAKYKELDSITVGNTTVIVERLIKENSFKEVYIVVSDLKEKERMILLVLYGDNTEAKNTLSLYMEDNSNYFVEMKDYKSGDIQTLILLEYYEEGSLYSYVKNNSLSDKDKDELIKRVLEIVCYLHDKSYLHIDIKPDNFFVSKGDIRLGDFATLTKLNNIQSDVLENVNSTKGYRYPNKVYSIKDELFALLATIYFIESSEVLIPEDRYLELSKKDDPEYEINEDARDCIDSLDRENVKDLLFYIINSIEENTKIDACDIKKTFKESHKEKENNNNTKSKFNLKKTLSIVFSFLVITAVAIGFILYHNPSPNSPKCNEAFFVKDDIIRVIQKDTNNIKHSIYYKYNFETKKFIRYNDNVMNIITQSDFHTNSKGYSIDCKNGYVKIYK